MGDLPEQIRSDLEELALDAIEATREMLLSGDTDTRINVINKVLPTVQKILAADDGGEGAGDAAREAREMLAEVWGPLAPKDKAS